MSIKIEAKISRGLKKGGALFPHRYAKGYVVSETRFARDQRFVQTFEEIASAISEGLSVRMSGADRRSPSLIAPRSITVSNLR